MATVFNQLLTRRYAEQVRRLLGDGETEFQSIAPELMIALVLESDRPEWAFLRGERLFSRATALGASVGNINHIQLFNPVGSNVLGVVEMMYASVATADQPTCLRNSAALGTQEGVQPPSRDSRIEDAATLQVRTLQQAAAATGRQCWRQAAGASVPIYVYESYVLDPGEGLFWITQTVNLYLAAGFVWRERGLRPEERRG